MNKLTAHSRTVQMQPGSDHDLMELFLEIDMGNVGREYFQTMGADYWFDDYGYRTVEEFDLHMAVGTYSDVYKDWSGRRPRIPNYTADQLWAEVDKLSKWVEEDIKEEKRQASIRRQEKRIRIATDKRKMKKVLAEVDPANVPANNSFAIAFLNAVRA